MNQPESKCPTVDVSRATRLMRLKHANTVLVEISKVGTRMWANDAGEVCRLRLTTDGRVYFRDHDMRTPTINLHSQPTSIDGYWKGFPYRGSDALLLHGLRDYVTNGAKIYRTLLVPLVQGRLSRGYTAADVAQIEERLRFVPIFVDAQPGSRP